MMTSAPFHGFFKPAGGGGFPTSPPLTDLELWLKADAGAYEDTGATDPVETNGDNVHRWVDQTANARVFQAVSGVGSTPVWNTNQLNGLPTLSNFRHAGGGGVNWFTAPSVTGLSLNADSTLLAVLKIDTLSTADWLILRAIGRYDLRLDNTGKVRLDRPGVENGVASTNALGTSAYRIITVHVSGTTVSHYLDGAANGTDTLQAVSSGTQDINVALHAAISGDYRLAEILAYDVALVQADREEAEDYLSGRYGITVTH